MLPQPAYIYIDIYIGVKWHDVIGIAHVSTNAKGNVWEIRVDTGGDALRLFAIGWATKARRGITESSRTRKYMYIKNCFFVVRQFQTASKFWIPQ